MPGPDIYTHSLGADSLKSLKSLAKSPSRPKFVFVRHGNVGVENGSLIHLARKNREARACLDALTATGYYTYVVKEPGTRLVHHDSVGEIWAPVRAGSYRISKQGVVYSLIPPSSGRRPGRLLVVFSAIHERAYTQSLMRYFMQNFASVQKYVPDDTAILRIGDLGGVVGAFYLPTTHRPGNADAVQALLSEVLHDSGVPLERAVLYGVSKGGTGALYHAMAGGFACVAVDPIVSDLHYELVLQDLHFTVGGAFVDSKQNHFRRQVKSLSAGSEFEGPGCQLSVVTSERSPQFRYIYDMLGGVPHPRLSILNSINPGIRDHPDVGPRTISATTMLLNMRLMGMSVTPGWATIP